MAELLDTLVRNLDVETLNRLGQQLGVDEDKIQQTVESLLPMLVGGLASNANRSEQEAQDLARALERDHDGSLLDGDLSNLLSSLLGGGRGASKTTDGSGILDHIFGSQRSAIERGIGQANGLDTGKVASLAGALAPLVMGALGKVKREKNLGTREMTEFLNREREEIQDEVPDAGQSGLMNFLDSNRDGKIDLSDDIAKVGIALGGAFLLGRRRKKN